MARVLTCPHGHQWELPDGELPPGAEPVCPICVSGREDPPPPSESAVSVAALGNVRETPLSVSVLQGKTAPEAAAASQPTGEPLPAGLPTVPGYEIRAVLGQGGMGVVYRAWQVRLKREVALKMILAGPHVGAEQLARFRTEAEAAARLHHPNVVQIHEIGEHEGRPFLALEYVNGGSLAEQLREASLPAKVAAELVETLARAMHAAHGQGVIHRDLKPANILLQKNQTTDGTDNTDNTSGNYPCSPCHPWFPKVADFGLAKQLGAEAGHTQSGAIMGTPSYMAPEQADGKVKEIGPTVDTYVLGAILYEALTGRPPFRGESPLDILEQVRSQEPVAPRLLQPKLPRDLETICLKCLRKDPRQRYDSALELAEDLRRFCEGRPILARPVGRVERLRKWVWRNPAWASLAGVVTLALVSLAGLSGYLYRTLQFARMQQQLATEKSQLAERQTELAIRNHFAALDLLDDVLPQMHQQNLKNWDLPYFRKSFLANAEIYYDRLLTNQEDPDPKNQRGIGRAFYGKGMVFFMRGKLDSAREQFERALAIQEKLVADGFGGSGCLYELSLTCNGLGDLLKDMSRPDEAVAAYRKAADAFTQLLTEDPRILKLALQFINKVSLMGKPEEAIAFLDQFIGRLETVLRTESRPDRRKLWGGAVQDLLAGRAMFNMELGRFPEAQKDWDRRSQDDAAPNAAQYQALRALNLAHLGKHEETAAALETLLQKKGKISASALAVAIRAYSYAIRPPRTIPT